VTRPRAVLFDVDGTLIDNRGAVERSLQRVRTWLPQLGLPGSIADELAAQLEVEEIARGGRPHFGDGLWLPWAYAPRYVDAALGEEHAPYGDRVHALWLRDLDLELGPFDDTLPALNRLAQAGISLGVASNSPLQRCMADFGLDGFRVELDVRSGLPAKPSPDLLLAACEALGVPPEGAVYVGDSVELDLTAAAAAGMRGILVDRPGYFRGERHDRVDDLLAVARQLTDRR